ncbi:MAG: transglutaminase domain-containing protein [Candidatus Aenigmarchaeota archaeon]|nr:transglutaminase domain-containing protein [Candidatus Aenigmarchaeota archaeon]
MRLVFVLFAAFLIIIPNAYAASSMEEMVLKDPASVKELTVDMEIYGTITADGNPTWIGINLTIPQDDEHQDVSMDMQRIKDASGTEFGYIEKENPGSSFSYSFSGTVTSRATYITSIPSSYTIPDDVMVYTQATENIQSENPRIKETAEFIVKDANDDFEKIAKLATWVNDQLEYDLSYSSKNYDAITVLDVKRGVCAEYTTLFTAFARSLGYPTRFVSAWAYGKYGWERHAYAEVYLGKWVPVDVLWMEIGYLDATHIRFGYYLDNKVKNSVNFRGYNINNIRWDTDETSLEIKDYSSREKQDDYELVKSGENLMAGDDGVVMLKFTPKDYRVATLDLEPCTGEFVIATVEEKNKKVILRPGEEETVYWRFSISDTLPRNFLLTCPLTLNSKSFAISSIDLEVDTTKTRSDRNQFSANLRSSMIKFGQTQIVYVYPDNYQGTIGVITPEDYRRWNSIGSEELRYQFTPKSLGDQNVIVFSSDGQVETLDYSVKSDVYIYMENIKAPGYLKTGETGKLTGDVINAGPVPKSLKMTIGVDGQQSSENILVDKKHTISRDFSFASGGVKEITINLKSSDIDITQSAVVNVFIEPEISYDVLYSEGTGKIVLNVKNSELKNVTVKIGNQEFEYDQIKKGKYEISAPIEKGKYVLEITYRDVAGNPYKASEEIEFAEEDFFAMLNRMINDLIEAIMGLFG